MTGFVVGVLASLVIAQGVIIGLLAEIIRIYRGWR